MLKYVLYAVLLLIVAGVVAGGVHLWRVAKRNKAEMSRYAESPREPLPDLGKGCKRLCRRGLACITPYGNSSAAKRCRRWPSRCLISPAMIW